MKIDEALKMADEWTKGQTFHENYEGCRPAIAVMLAEIETLRETVARCNKIMSEDIHVERLLYENGALDLDATHPLGKAIIASLVSVYVSSGADNYFEMNCYHPQVGLLAVTIQRVEGKSPGQVAGELLEELRLLKESC